jgi:cell division septation protein DedD
MATDTANPLAAGDTAELYRAAIGPRGQDYYLRQFARFDAAGKTGASWHWAAYWSTLNWLIYRKMWGQALAYVAAILGMALLVFGVGKLLLSYDSTTGLALFLLFLTAAFVVPGLYANAWYYNFCNEKISAALRATQDVPQACELLATQASSNRRFMAQAVVNVALAALVTGLATLLLDPAQEMMQLAQGGAAQSQPAMPEMAAGSQPVLAPGNGALVAAAPTPAQTPTTTEATAAPAAAAASAAVAEATTEPPKPEAPAPDTAAAPAAPRFDGPVLTSAAQIDEYLARVSGVPREPAVQLAGKAAEPADAKTQPAADKPTGPADSVVQVAAEPKRAQPARAAALPVAAAASDTPAAPARNGKATSKAAASAKTEVAAGSPTAEAAPPAVAGKPKRTPTKKSWYVQAGAFAQESNAQNVRLRIEAAGLETSTAPHETQAGRLIRVRVGPYATKADAEKAALQVKALELPAVLFRE